MAAQSIDFHLPEQLNAAGPPERRGIRRDHVRMLVLNKKTQRLSHDCFFNLDKYLHPGDMIVLNNSRTLPAVLMAKLADRKPSYKIEVRLAKKLTENKWDVLINFDNINVGDILYFSKDLIANVLQENKTTPLKTIQFSKSGADLYEYIYSAGEPIRYEYINKEWPLDYYQTVYASRPGSVEMPSAGRAFSWELLFKLQKKGVKLAYIQLHTGLSYLLDDKWDHSPERNVEEYFISSEAMKMIHETKNAGGRVIAVGTTVVRALESAALTGELSGWTNLYIRKNSKLNIADGIITGLHEPKASHLELLSAFVDEKVLIGAYKEAIRQNYLWHEFGDVNLIL